MSTNVGNCMTRDALVTVDPGASVADARTILHDRGISHLLVTDPTLCGVLCVCDLERASSGDPVESASTN